MDKIQRGIRDHGTLEDYIEFLERGRNKRKLEKKKRNKELPVKYVGMIERSEKKGLEMTLTIEEYHDILGENCVYCGSKGETVDRINSLVGYTPENTQPCCNMCNMMKYTHSNEAFLAQIDKIFAFIHGK